MSIEGSICNVTCHMFFAFGTEFSSSDKFALGTKVTRTKGSNRQTGVSRRFKLDTRYDQLTGGENCRLETGTLVRPGITSNTFTCSFCIYLSDS